MQIPKTTVLTISTPRTCRTEIAGFLPALQHSPHRLLGKTTRTPAAHGDSSSAFRRDGSTQPNPCQVSRYVKPHKLKSKCPLKTSNGRRGEQKKEGTRKDHLPFWPRCYVAKIEHNRSEKVLVVTDFCSVCTPSNIGSIS